MKKFWKYFKDIICILFFFHILKKEINPEMIAEGVPERFPKTSKIIPEKGLNKFQQMFIMLSMG